MHTQTKVSRLYYFTVASSTPAKTKFFTVFQKKYFLILSHAIDNARTKIRLLLKQPFVDFPGLTSIILSTVSNSAFHGEVKLKLLGCTK
jgi:hypothetical protein